MKQFDIRRDSLDQSELREIVAMVMERLDLKIMVEDYEFLPEESRPRNREFYVTSDSPTWEQD